MAIPYLVAIDLSKNELQNARIQNLSTAPSSPVTGQVYYDTDDNLVYFWDGDSWESMSGGTIDYGETGDIDSIAFGQTADAGVLNESARADHSHGMAAHDDAAHNSVELNDLAAPDGPVAFANQNITGLADPSNPQDAATKSYVDAAVAGLAWKEPVRVATTAAGTLASSFENGDTVDGVTLATGDRLLIKDQSSGQENGIYTVNASGAPTRALDADSDPDLRQSAVFVLAGTANADTGWVLTTDTTPIVVNTTVLTFVQFTGLGQVTAGNGLTKTANTINVGAGTGIAVNTDDVAVLRTDANGRVPLRYAASYGDGAATSFNIDHNLNSLDVLVQCYRVSDGVEVMVDVTRSTVNRVILTHAVAPTSNQYRTVVYG